MNSFDTVIYHGNCYDGFTAAWVARRHSPNAEFIPAQYGDAPPDVTDNRVLVVDFSYKRQVLLGMHEVAEELVVLDHHKTAAADLAGLDFAIFDMGRSGAGMAWDYLFPDEPRPWIVNAVEDRDLWRFALSNTKALHAAMTLREMSFENWDELAWLSPADVVMEGDTVLRFTQLTAIKLAARARITPLAGGLVWAVNCPVELVSETAEILKHREPYLPVLGFSWDGERGDWYCSLRSRDDGPDVSEIAKLFGGGGHEHAAGFRLVSVPVDVDDELPEVLQSEDQITREFTEMIAWSHRKDQDGSGFSMLVAVSLRDHMPRILKALAEPYGRHWSFREKFGQFIEVVVDDA